MENPKKIEIIPDDVIMDIKVSGTFYKRTQALFIYLSEKKDPKEFLLYYANIMKGGEPKTEYDFHIYTVLSLLLEMEKVAKEKGLTQEKEMPPELRKVT
jgi:hypothetical protein